MSFNRPTLSELIGRARADYDARLPGADSALARSVLDVLARVQSGAVAGLYGFLDFIARQILPDTAEAEYLARHAAIWGMARQAATTASGTILVSGSDTAVVPAGTVLIRADGTRYHTLAAAVLDTGATIAVEAEDAGIGGNAVPHAQLTFASPIVGVVAVATVDEDGLGGGAAEEDDVGLLARLLQRIRNPAQGGAKADYERWTLEVAGVTRVWVYPLYLGAGTVGIAFVMDGREDIIPLGADIDVVQAHLDEVRPVTADVTVFAPEPQPIDMLIRLSPATAEVKAAVEAELADLFTRDSAPGGTIWRSRISEAISTAAGESHHELMLPSADIVAGPGFMPALGTVSWAS